MCACLVRQSLSGQALLYFAIDCRLVSDSTRRSISAVSQCRIKVGAIGAAALGPRPRTRKGKVFSILVVISLVGIILTKIIKTVATRCHILKLKCIKFDFGCGSAPDPAGKAYTRPLTCIYLGGVLLRGRMGGEGKAEVRGRKGSKVGGKGDREWKERGKEMGSGREGVDTAWPDLQLSLRDATAAASGESWS